MAKHIQNPPGFRATGQGYYNKLPDYAANATTGNGLFINYGLNPTNKNYQIYTFVTGITTGWSIAGDYGQSASARTFYPKNLSQDAITIEGIVANQYEYDRLTEFMIAHQTRAVDVHNPKDTDPTRALEFRMRPFRVPAGRDKKGNIVYRYINRGLPDGDNGIKVQGYVLNWAAGHTRFVNAPRWTCDLKVTYDFLSNPVHLQGEMNQILEHDYIQTFGQLYKQVTPKQRVIKMPTGDGFDTNVSGDFFNDPSNFFTDPNTEGPLFNP